MKNRGKSKGPRFPAFVDQSDDGSMAAHCLGSGRSILVVGGGAGGKSMFCNGGRSRVTETNRGIENHVA